MRTLLASVLLLVACDDGGGSRPPDGGNQNGIVDAAPIVDAPPMDTPIDSAIVDAILPDASIPIPANVTAACTNVCNKLGTCSPFSSAELMDCIEGCSEDLLDCSTQQVMDVDACVAADCGDFENEDSPLIDCIVAITCVDM